MQEREKLCQIMTLKIYNLPTKHLHIFHISMFLVLELKTKLLSSVSPKSRFELLNIKEITADVILRVILVFHLSICLFS